MHTHLIQDTIILFSLAVCAVILFRRFNLPAILGYLFVGIIAGPYLLGWMQSNETTHLLGEIGVVFLLFTIGLEFSFSKFLRMRNALFGLGGTQVLIGTISGMLIAIWIGIKWEAALIIGGALALSSTAIVLKQLGEQLELNKPHGRVALSILLFQDIAAIPFLVMIPVFASDNTENMNMLLIMALAKGVVALLILLGIGRWLLRPIFHEVANLRSQELFTLTVLLIALLAAWLTYLMGLSLALGAFIAGMMLGETEYRHHIETEIRPFRDILMGLFFITVGMQLNIFAVINSWYWVGLLLVGLMLGKGIFIGFLTRFANYSNATAVKSGIVLGQGGEFGIALLSLSLSTGLINHEEIQPVLAAIILSMAMAPLFIRYSESLTNRLLKKNTNDDIDSEFEIVDEERTNHIILCGYGRTGQRIQKVLEQQHIKTVAIDNDSKVINATRKNSQEIYFGDASDIRILESLGLSKAAAVLITFNNIERSKNIITTLRQTNYEVPIISRAYNQEDMEILIDAGATEVVPEDLETSLMLVTQLLLVIGMPLDDVLNELNNIKKDHYSLLNDNK